MFALPDPPPTSPRGLPAPGEPAARSRTRFPRWILACLLGLGLLPLGCGKAKSPKVLVIGLDGATWDLVQPWMDQGYLPNLKAIRDGGAFGPLTSVLPPMSPPAWTTAGTGVNPGEHGIFDFFRLDQDSLVVYNESAESRRVPGIWTLLDEEGYKVGTLNIPLTSPPDPLEHGFQVGGMPHTNNDSLGIATPPEVEAKLHEMGYLVDQMGLKIVEGHNELLRDEIMATLATRRRAAVELAKMYPDLDLYWVVFTGTDRMQHFFWKFMEPEHPLYEPDKAATLGTAIRDLWVETDAAVGELVSTVRAQADAQGRELAIVVLSDHGFYGVHRVFRPKSFLGNPPDGKEPIKEVYALENNASLLYVPAHGRERLAPLTEDEHERLVDEIKDRIMAVEDTVYHKKPAVGGWRKEEVYHGRYMEKAPDLVFLAAKPYYFIFEEGNKEPFGLPGFTFNAHHDMTGILMAQGPMFRTGKIEGHQSLYDIAPTLMYLAGAEVPGYFEGDVLTSILTKKFLDGHPVRRDASTARDVGGTPENIKAIPYVQ